MIARRRKIKYNGFMNVKTIAVNKIALHDYFIDETYECGVVLEGAEVKSVRGGKVNLKDSFCLISNGEVFMKNAHISVFDGAGKFNSREEKRDRKLLLKRAEISRIAGKVNQKGYALVPLKMYFKDALVKVEIGLCRGKHTYDKKQTLKEKDLSRKADREIKEFR